MLRWPLKKSRAVGSEFDIIFAQNFQIISTNCDWNSGAVDLRRRGLRFCPSTSTTAPFCSPRDRRALRTPSCRQVNNHLLRIQDKVEIRVNLVYNVPITLVLLGKRNVVLTAPEYIYSEFSVRWRRVRSERRGGRRDVGQRRLEWRLRNGCQLQETIRGRWRSSLLVGLGFV